jgi:hypothetical protein
VYNRSIKIYQGIDNPILIQIKNQDQKSVDLKESTVIVEIQDPESELSILSYVLSWQDAAKGIGSFTFYKVDIDSLVNRYYKMTLKLSDNLSRNQRPLYSDDNYNVNLDLEVLPAYYSKSTDVIDGGGANSNQSISL